ncbi:MAG TPA: glutamine-hydrolyzing carbamoyl-phosphate synthase small subunit [Planctomycetota bacterium]|nr:glutamine-hydrolyzing carbamoyl-phosphate synthase small subunit [Planctomycetota bacterium]
MQAKLALEDGTVFTGRSFGAPGERSGEVCFNTSMMGYQEILTDPSYAGQIVTMTYPLIGNVGVNDEDVESARPWVEGFVVREASRIASNFRSQMSLQDYLVRHGIIGIEGIDTRALTRHIRTRGAMIGVLSTIDLADASLVQKAKTAPRLVGCDWVAHVTAKQAYPWADGFTCKFSPEPRGQANSEFRIQNPESSATEAAVDCDPRPADCDPLPADRDPQPADPKAQSPKPNALPPHVVAMDFGTKNNILRHLVDIGCRVTVVPASATADEILALEPDGIFLSNGPGDPEACGYAVQTIRSLIGKRPIFGICMGHELLALALGGRIVKLKFGHRGGNQPVIELATGTIDITCQNHGFAVDADSLDPEQVEITHLNLNDRTCEGLRMKRQPVFSVQHHPESSPGPRDAAHHFDTFARMLAGEGRWWEEEMRNDE